MSYAVEKKMKQKAQLLRLVSWSITPTYLFHDAKVVYFLVNLKIYKKINNLSPIISKNTLSYMRFIAPSKAICRTAVAQIT